jgi:hypothetical protein
MARFISIVKKAARHPWIRLLCLFVCFFLCCATCIHAQDLAAGLRKMNSLRKGSKTPFDQLETLAQDLLKKYSYPEEKGRIYYQLAHVYGQSGLIKPEKVVFYAQKAREYPLEQWDKATLFVYEGDALSIGNRNQSFADRRRSAARVYFEGLRFIEGLDLAGKPDETRQKMFKHRDVMVNQIISLYGRKPYDDKELENAANEFLKDSDHVRRVISKAAVVVTKNEARYAEATKKLPGFSPAPTGIGVTLMIYIALGVGAVVGIVTAVIFFRKNANRKESQNNSAPKKQ